MLQVALAKAWGLGGTALSECVAQDLRLGEDGQLEAGDSVEVKYTAHELLSRDLGDVIDRSVDGDRATRFKVGRGRTIKVRKGGVSERVLENRNPENKYFQL